MKKEKLFREMLLTQSEDITPLIENAAKVIMDIYNIFSNYLNQPIQMYESEDEYEKQQRKFKQTLAELQQELDKQIPRIQKSIKNLTWSSTDNKYIIADEAKEIIEKINIRIPIIQDGFNTLIAQTINLINIINKLIDTLNQKNKTLPKKPNIVLRPIRKLINNFTRRK
jgi:hypothetical protein